MASVLKGPGSGFGYGYGFGETLGVVDTYPVRLLAPWPYLRIGCETHSLGEWRTEWRAIAKKHGANVGEGLVRKLEAAVLARLHEEQASDE